MPHVRRLGLPSLVAALALLAGCGGPTAVRTTYPDGHVLSEGLVIRRAQAGLWVYYHPTGTKQAEGAWESNKQFGQWTWWYPDGTVQHQGSYVLGGLRDGTWKSFHANGKPASEGAYRFDRQDGPWRFWTAEGGPLAAGTFDLGVKHGWWVRRNPDGTPLESGLFVKGLKCGPWTVWKTGEPTVHDFGAPTGAVASLADGTWTMSGAASASIAFGADGLPTKLSLSSDGRTVTALPEDLPAFAVKPAAAPVAPVVEVPPATTPPAIPVAPLVAIRSPVPASAPLAPAAPAQVESPEAAAGLSPLPLLPTLIPESDRAKAEELIKLYTSGSDPLNSGGIDDYSWQVKGGDPAARKLIGMKLPQDRFLSSTGSVIDLTRFKKPVVVVLMRGFSGQVCVYCATQTAALANNYKRFTDAGAEVVVIYPGPTEAVPAFVQAVQSLRKDPPPMGIGLDVSLLLVRGLGVEENLARPTSLVLDADGKVAFAYIGTNPADRPSVDDLLQALRKIVK